ncbi:MAG TPA: AMP-binding protein, partial [Luteimonas sp.]|nr:AMP-binding protein [Luteimonas sp.]
MAHWQDALGGSAARFELATDRPRAGRPAGGIGEFRERIDATTVDALAAKADREGQRVSEMLFATWTACLARLSGQDDVLVGLADAANGDAVLPVRVDFDGAWTPVQLLAHVAGRIGDARLVGGIDAAGMAVLAGRVHGDAAEPLFRAVFELQDGGGIEGGAQPAVPADVAIAVGPGGEPGLEVRVRFADALFDAATMRRYVGHWLTLLRGVALAGDATPMAAITLLDDAERHQVLEAFNATQADFPADSCIHELVEAQVGRTPDAVAVTSEADSLTYAQLNARANQLAHHLRGLGVGPDDRVAICIERGLEMVVGLLAILKAGGAYVPLDPSYPADRLRYMLEDCAPVALLTQASLEPVWSPAVEQADLALPVLDLQDAQAWRDAPTDNIDRAGIGLAPDNLAYVIYTSGSTGMPKGVMNEHRGVVNRLWWMQAAYRLDADDAVLQKTPFGFDVSVWEFFWPLQVGARLVMAREQGHKEPAYLAGLIR